ncbi:alpha-galactosidase [Amycolatopsis xylanica]|nr:alpha-galactosidase [Amycolatopsis xylanica]
MKTTSYTTADRDGWTELVAWGPHGVEDGPSPFTNQGEIHFMTAADAAPIEYATSWQRPFSGADLDAPAVDRLRIEPKYEVVPGTDVLLRWVEVTNTGDSEVVLERLGSAGVCVPTGKPLLTFLSGQWAREFQRRQVVLPAGRFQMESRFGVPGHGYAPWLAVQDAEGGQAWGVSLAWSGSWEIDASVEPAGITRIRAGRLGPVVVGPGETVASPRLALASSVDGLDGLARVWHEYERTLSRPVERKVLYNSWEATGFDVQFDRQLALAKRAAAIGVELFVVDDGWFVGRDDDTGGLGDWEPADPSFGEFVEEVRALGLDFGLWVEPESVSPKSRLYAEHPDWVYHRDGHDRTLIRNQLLLNLGREDVFEFLRSTLDRLLGSYAISYLKWDMNRPATERDLALDGAHVANYHRLLDHVRERYPHVTVEACAGGGGRTDLATIARADVVWPSDNTGPLDRLAIQDGFLLAHAPHLMSSWVTDSPGFFDPRPRSLRFRFVLAMAGVLGIGADLSRWTDEQLAEATVLIAQYKEIRSIIHSGQVCRSPNAVQYSGADGTVVVLAWNTGELTGAPFVPGRSSRVPLTALAAESYVDESGRRFSASHLTHAGLAFDWTPEFDADFTVLHPVS